MDRIAAWLVKRRLYKLKRYWPSGLDSTTSRPPRLARCPDTLDTRKGFRWGVRAWYASRSVVERKTMSGVPQAQIVSSHSPSAGGSCACVSLAGHVCLYVEREAERCDLSSVI